MGFRVQTGGAVFNLLHGSQIHYWISGVQMQRRKLYKSNQDSTTPHKGNNSSDSIDQRKQYLQDIATENKPYVH